MYSGVWYRRGIPIVNSFVGPVVVFVIGFSKIFLFDGSFITCLSFLLCSPITNISIMTGHHESGGITGFLKGIADSMRESSGIERHDTRVEADVPHDGAGSSILASISGVAAASQQAGWGDIKGAKHTRDVAKPSLSAETGSLGVEGSLPAVSGDVSVPDVDASLSAPSAKESLSGGEPSLPSGSMGVSGEFLFHLIRELYFLYFGVTQYKCSCPCYVGTVQIITARSWL